MSDDTLKSSPLHSVRLIICVRFIYKKEAFFFLLGSNYCSFEKLYFFVKAGLTFGQSLA